MKRRQSNCLVREADSMSGFTWITVEYLHQSMNMIVAARVRLLVSVVHEAKTDRRYMLLG
jgi:hypothetical protein